MNGGRRAESPEREGRTMKAMLFDIQRNSYVDGPGIRTTVFFKGCNLRCGWCHNPESQRPESQILYYRDKCAGCGRCRDAGDDPDFLCFHDAREVCGREYTVGEVWGIIERDRAYYDASGGGATFSGGECMLQLDFLEANLKKCRENGVHTAIDTAGCVPWESFERILPWTDLFLYDLKCASEDLHREGTGVSNRLILENLARLAERRGDDLVVRIPVIPGFNASEEEMRKTAEILKGIRRRGTELLPYHGMGEHKYAALGRKAGAFRAPAKEETAAFEEILKGAAAPQAPASGIGGLRPESACATIGEKKNNRRERRKDKENDDGQSGTSEATV